MSWGPTLGRLPIHHPISMYIGSFLGAGPTFRRRNLDWHLFRDTTNLSPSARANLIWGGATARQDTTHTQVIPAARRAFLRPARTKGTPSSTPAPPLQLPPTWTSPLAPSAVQSSGQSSRVLLPRIPLLSAAGPYVRERHDLGQPCVIGNPARRHADEANSPNTAVAAARNTRNTIHRL